MNDASANEPLRMESFASTTFLTPHLSLPGTGLEYLARRNRLKVRQRRPRTIHRIDPLIWFKTRITDSSLALVAALQTMFESSALGRLALASAVQLRTWFDVPWMRRKSHSYSSLLILSPKFCCTWHNNQLFFSFIG